MSFDLHVCHSALWQLTRLQGTMLCTLPLAVLAALVPFVGAATSSQSYTWKNVKIGGGGGFVPGMRIAEPQLAGD
jgi:hypothetical protein